MDKQEYETWATGCWEEDWQQYQRLLALEALVDEALVQAKALAAALAAIEDDLPF